ncbi:MAG: type VI secretion system-associated protein TagF [Planctomycetes bacterium]|nr:type VI secretion system-associated protein TagF [Planctomycetota bacterium]
MITLRAECFGKLPAHGDFIRHHAGPELLELDQWLQAGLLAVRDRPDRAAAWPATPPLRFVRRGPGGRLLAGVLVASRDAAGRDYPFVIAAPVEGREVAQRPELTPLVVEPFLAAAEAVATRPWEGLDHRAVTAEVDRLVGEVDPRAAEQRLALLLATATLEALLASGDAPPAAAPLLLDNAATLLGPRARPRFVLALPGAIDADHVAVWLAFVATLRGDASRFPPLVTWSTDPRGAAAGLRLVLVEPAGEHFVPLALRHLPSDACDLAREGLDSAGLMQKARERVGALVDGPRTVADLAPRLAALAR